MFRETFLEIDGEMRCIKRVDCRKRASEDIRKVVNCKKCFLRHKQNHKIEGFGGMR